MLIGEEDDVDDGEEDDDCQGGENVNCDDDTPNTVDWVSPLTSTSASSPLSWGRLEVPASKMGSRSSVKGGGSTSASFPASFAPNSFDAVDPSDWMV